MRSVPPAAWFLSFCLAS